jgi:pimeloyl-ACP methyl ester carboxylesterase
MLYHAPAWLPGGHCQTIWPALITKRLLRGAPGYRRERWATPDADFIDLDWAGEATEAPLLVLFHGLEGSSQSHYAQAFAQAALSRGWRFVVPHFRGCSGEMNLAPRAYHSGDHAEVGWILQRLRHSHAGRIYAVGVSLGGNALLRWAQEAGPRASESLSAVAAVCAPLDLTASGHAIGRGAARGAQPVRVRQRRDGATAWLSRHRRLLGARLGQAPLGAAANSHAGIERAQRSLRSGGEPAFGRRGRGAPHTLATRAGRPRRIPRRALAWPSAGAARASAELARRLKLREHREMDAIVEAALRKWPNVPHCFGWLGLDARGDWFLRDEQTQAAGNFARAKGSRIEHRGLREFIHRNYAADAMGCWFFQNGPQRVYVELEFAPWIWRLADSSAAPAIEAHTGRAARFESAWLDEAGRLFLATDLGLGLVHSIDMERASRAVDIGFWRVSESTGDALAARFRCVLSPAALHAA